MEHFSAWGAAPSDWDTFVRLGLTADLLPVVSNPDAKIAPKSNLRSLGKVPSAYTNDREVVGIPSWTSKQSDERSVNRWKRDSDLGICLQTRLVRAVDVDIDDTATCETVRWWVDTVLGVTLPERFRPDSGKFLLAFEMKGEFAKRVIHTAHGAIEFLANGQQFIACGTHPKGSRYRWQGGLPEAFPAVTPAQFEQLWAALNTSLALDPELRGRGLSRKVLLPRNSDDISDPLVSFLDATGWVKGWQRDGRVDVRCPWEHEHTTDSGDSATTYFPAGVGGFSQGHFRCLHSHCETRTDQEFIEAVSYIEDSFEVATVSVATNTDGVPAEGTEELPMPVFQRKRNGTIIPNVNNLSLALRRPDVCGCHIAYDAFTDAIVLAEPVADLHTAQWRSFGDADYTELRATLERRGFDNIGREVVRDVALLVARDQKIDTAIEWLTHRVEAWDGVSRVGSFWVDYFGVQDSAYARAVSAYTWSALAGRVLSPGVKADMIPVLISPEGTAKTTGVAAIAPAPEFFAQLSLGGKDDDLARKMRGKLVAELAELRGLHTRDREGILDWVTRTHEAWIPKFREFETIFPRRLLMIGTTNEEQFLDDTGGEDRRWLPLRAGLTNMVQLIADREQLWAEARELFLKSGVQWQGARELALEVRGEHRFEDPWKEVIWAWLCSDGMGDDGKQAPVGLQLLKSSDIFSAALGVRNGDTTKIDEMRLGRVLRSLGFSRKVLRVHGHNTRLWQADIDAQKALVCRE